MKFQFDNLKKLSPDPAVRLLAMKNIKLETPLKSPASAPVPVVLNELQEAEAPFDIMRLLAVALPAREAVWWACLAARDIVGHDAKKVPPPLDAAERWVFRPTEENRDAARVAIDTADMKDETVYCAMAAVYAEGNLGPGEMSKIEAPPNGVPAMVLSMNVMSLGKNAATFEDHTDLLILRALDIARGGNGHVRLEPADADQAISGMT